MRARELGDRASEPGSVLRTWLAVGESWTGPVRLPLVVITGARPGPKVAAVAAQHGDEAYATLALLDVADAVQPENLAGQLWLLPCLNVHGFVHGKRVSPFDHQDMNRVHPGSEGGTLTQEIAAVLAQHVLPGSDLLLDLHGGSPEVGDIAFGRWTDAPGKPSVRPLAETLPLRFLLAPGARDVPGMLSEVTPQLGVPQIAIEAGSTDRPARANAAEMAGFVTDALAYLGMIPGERPQPRPLPVMRTVSNPARAGGAFLARVSLGDEVRRGQGLGEVRNLLGEVVQELTAGVDGIVAVMRTGVRVHPGESLVTLATEA